MRMTPPAPALTPFEPLLDTKLLVILATPVPPSARTPLPVLPEKLQFSAVIRELIFA